MVANSYEDPEEQAPVDIMGTVIETKNVAYADTHNYQKQASMISPTGADNTRWETTSVFMTVSEEVIRKSTGRVNAPLDFWGCTVEKSACSAHDLD